MNLPLDRKIPRDFAGAGADGGLACAVEINESVKRIVALAAHINKIGVNAILLAHRAGDPLVVDACLKLFREKGYRLPDH